MAVGGRKPKPTHLKVLEGNPGKRKLNKGEPKPRPIRPPRPEWLEGEARAEWERVVPELERMGLLTVVDLAALVGYCVAWGEVIQFDAFLQANGRTLNLRSGYLQPRPEVAMREKAWQRLKAFLTEFGFTPSSRARLSIKPTGEKDPMKQLLDG